VRHGAEQRLHRVHCEVGILEDEQKAEVADNAEREAGTHPPAVAGNMPRHRVIAQRREHNNEHKSRLAPSIEKDADQQDGAVAPGRRHGPIDHYRQRQKQK